MFPNCHRVQVQTFGIDFDHGQVGVPVFAYDLGRRQDAVGELHDHAAGAQNDMAIGDNVSLIINNKARAFSCVEKVGADFGVWRILQALLHPAPG